MVGARAKAASLPPQSTSPRRVSYMPGRWDDLRPHRATCHASEFCFRKHVPCAMLAAGDHETPAEAERTCLRERPRKHGTPNRQPLQPCHQLHAKLHHDKMACSQWRRSGARDYGLRRQRRRFRYRQIIGARAKAASQPPHSIATRCLSRHRPVINPMAMAWPVRRQGNLMGAPGVPHSSFMVQCPPRYCPRGWMIRPGNRVEMSGGSGGRHEEARKPKAGQGGAAAPPSRRSRGIPRAQPAVL